MQAGAVDGKIMVDMLFYAAIAAAVIAHAVDVGAVAMTREETKASAATALMKGQSAKTALKRAATPYRKRVRANHKRLTK
jgi:hypothetical protein